MCTFPLVRSKFLKQDVLNNMLFLVDPLRELHGFSNAHTFHLLCLCSFGVSCKTKLGPQFSMSWNASASSGEQDWTQTRGVSGAAPGHRSQQREAGNMASGFRT